VGEKSNNNNDVYNAVVMAKPLRELLRSLEWILVSTSWLPTHWPSWKLEPL